MQRKVLDVKNLSTTFNNRKTTIKIVDNISIEVYEGESLGIVGESGCGKSLTALSLMGLVKKPAEVNADFIIFDEEIELNKLSKKEIRKFRGSKMSMIFQEPMTALNPVLKIGNQISEILKVHQKLSKKELNAAVIELIKKVGIPRPEEIAKSYPHQLSGGMRQRIMIAIAIACKPKLIIADEPTTALDVTIQAQILDLLKSIQNENNMALMLITHDLGVVNEVCDRVAVMYAGKVIEIGPVKTILSNPKHPYTKGLLDSLPTSASNNERLSYIKGNVPQPQNWSKGCRFADRCPNVMERCHRLQPELNEIDTDRKIACWLYEDEVNI